MTDDDARKRRFLLGTIGVVVLIGLAGGTIALLSGSGSDDETGTGRAPGGSATVGAETLCSSAHVTTYQVVAGGKVRPAPTAAAALAPWGTALVSSTSTGAGATTALVALGKPGKPPREVLTITQGKQGWVVTATSACLDELEPNADCAISKLTIDRTTLAAAPPDSAPGAGTYTGQGALTACVSYDAQTYAARGVIAPVSAFGAAGKAKGSVVIVADGSPELFTP